MSIPVRYSVDVRQEGATVQLLVNGVRRMGMPWELADIVAKALKLQCNEAKLWLKTRVSRADPEIRIRSNPNVITIRQEGNMILFLGNGILLFDIPFRHVDESGVRSPALRLWAAFNMQARQAEASTKLDQIAYDAAILHRSGAPFGISDDPRVKDEARKLAVHDRDLRRFMMDGIRSAEVLGTPRVSLETRPPFQQLLEIAETLTPEEREALRGRLDGLPLKENSNGPIDEDSAPNSSQGS